MSDGPLNFRQRLSRIPFLASLHRHLEVWRIAWVQERRQPPRVTLRGAELEFLPAVLEVQESPPSPAGRAVMFTVIGVFTVAVLWAAFGHIDIVAVAQGKIVPSDRSKVIQPLETGVITAIHVRDGSRVKQGDPLIDLDTQADADHSRVQNEYQAALLEAARLKALLADRDRLTPPPGADPKLVAAAQHRLSDELTEYRALKTQAKAYKKLLDAQYVAELKYLEYERERAEKANEHTAALTAAEVRARSLEKELAKATVRAGQQHLTAPIDGVIQQLAVHTVGGVVTPAQTLMVVAPEEGLIEVEAFLENKDIGFVNEAQAAEVKIDAFPFTRYGTIDGQVVSLSKDAVQIENVGLVYTARVALDRATIRVETKDVRLSPGMTVAVEIKTGKRRLIEYFLSPLIRAGKESVRER